MRFRLLLIAITFIIISCFIANSNAKVIERILVIINDEIITQTEFDERIDQTKEMLKQVYKYNDAKLAEELEKSKPQILDTMVDEILFVQEAVKRSIQISDADVLKEINNIKKQFASDDEFMKAIETEGYTLDSLKREKKRTLLLQELIKQKFASELTVDDDEVKKFYNENRDQFPGKKDTVSLKHLFIRFNLAQADKDKAKQKAEMVLQQIKDGADFADMVDKFSDDPETKANKGDMGYFIAGAGNLPEIEDAASKLNVNQISDIIENPDGYSIIKITDKTADGKMRAQIIFIAVPTDSTEEKVAEDKANSIIQELKNGADFVDMVKKYSDDKKSKEKDGDWMDVPIESMGAELQGAFSSLDAGNVSQPIKSPQGIHIFKITEKKDLTNEEMEQIRMFLSEKKLQDKLRNYSEKLKETAYIQPFNIKN